ncbi:hypothetical protein [Actinophytocola oryzae]|uniref:Uncharacterized protein n=1 Tax=Actinophytocola oryzae TaxID=502181 RepID=A0A4R7UTX3_9PSEU|nr:hypothetical protein [Actinophytocola oryzae]TDV40113.1 hypothetical protein CLV71_124132 [Actinophytocola oryzae]
MTQRAWRPSVNAPLVVHYADTDRGLCGIPVDPTGTEGPTSTLCPECLTWQRRAGRTTDADER